MTEETTGSSPPSSSKTSAVCSAMSVMSVALAAVVFGMALGFTSPANDVMADTVKDAGDRPLPAPSSLVVFKSEAEAALFGALVNVGALCGALSGGPLSERIGRKPTILLIAPLYTISWLGMALSSSFVPLLVGRFFLGVGIGACSATVPTYINEVAPTSLRGAFGASFQLAIVLGIMFANLLGAYVLVYEKDGHNFCHWRQLAMSAIVFCIALFVLTLAIPESPAWLASVGQQEKAQSALKRLRGGTETREEIEELRNASERRDSSESSGGLRDLLHHKRACSIVLMLMVVQQFSGVNAVIFFQDTIFQAAGMHDPAALGFYVMLLQVVMTAVSIPLMDTLGRKVLLTLSMTGMAFCCIGLVIFFAGGRQAGWLAMVCSFGYISFFSLGLGPIPWLMMGEILPPKIKATGSSLAAACNWTCSFITTETVSSLQKEIHFSGVFAVYGVVLILGGVYVVLRVPETKGKSFAEIEALLSQTNESAQTRELTPAAARPFIETSGNSPPT